MRDWPDGCVGLVLTDPPYGIGKRLVSGGKGHGFDALILSDALSWDIRPNKEIFERIFSLSHEQMIWGGNFFELPPCECPVCWDKVRPNQKNVSEWEYAWTSLVGRARLFRYCANGGFVAKETRQRPTQKPLALMLWALEVLFPSAMIIFDPFCGSGTTCVAAKMLGRHYIGIDISEKYCQIARERLRAVDTGVPVKEARQGQMPMFREV